MPVVIVIVVVVVIVEDPGPPTLTQDSPRPGLPPYLPPTSAQDPTPRLQTRADHVTASTWKARSLRRHSVLVLTATIFPNFADLPRVLPDLKEGVVTSWKWTAGTAVCVGLLYRRHGSSCRIGRRLGGYLVLSNNLEDKLTCSKDAWIFFIFCAWQITKKAHKTGKMSGFTKSCFCCTFGALCFEVNKSSCKRQCSRCNSAWGKCSCGLGWRFVGNTESSCKFCAIYRGTLFPALQVFFLRRSKRRSVLSDVYTDGVPWR